MSAMSNNPAPAKPSASVVVVRQGTESLEVLLLRRNEQIAFHGGAWVFPGGRVDPDDGDVAAEPEIEIAKRAGVRETLEETGLAVTAESMLPFAHWTTPVDLPKRFATWFFIATIERASDVRIDNSEIVDFRWLTPAAALQQQSAGEINLPAPTFVTLLTLQSLPTTAELQARFAAREIQRFVPKLVSYAGGRCTLYQDDSGYATGDLETSGPRHRLIMKDGGWEYIREI